MSSASLIVVVHLIADFLELFSHFEIAVDACEPNEGHLIELAQCFHDHFADFAGLDIGLAAVLQPSNNTRDDPLDTVAFNGPLVQRNNQ